ncbi:Uncharacterised protein [Bordetella pertussis]|nr:Uncharacterised protein [Bordetella pertussis]CFO67893.1 Uncharacterised protein [Bordetella pertussis]CFU81275.1 Uncharacterised protein [Bordetella pertussis]CPI75731.1 Uncharacterised protein [Bordetella pertussis]CPL17999.1 Uncharacterised protein [Bordetella pertussis]
MAVSMKRSTKIAPDSLSTSYFTGSAFMGISMMTLKSSGSFLPGATRSRLMIDLVLMKMKSGFVAGRRAGG